MRKLYYFVFCSFIVFFCVIFNACGSSVEEKTWSIEDNGGTWYIENRLALPNFVNSKYCSLVGEKIYAINMEYGYIWGKNIFNGKEEHISIDNMINLNEEKVVTFNVVKDGIIIGTYLGADEIIIRKISISGELNNEMIASCNTVKASHASKIVEVEGQYYILIGSDLFTIKGTELVKVTDESYTSLVSDGKRSYAELVGDGNLLNS